jgi:hypothetical protein
MAHPGTASTTSKRGGDGKRRVLANGLLQWRQRFKQARLSPEFNALDIGVWSVIKVYVDENLYRLPKFDTFNREAVCDSMWELCREAWNDALTPEKLWPIFEQRRAILEEVFARESAPLLKDPHSGVRKAARME